MAWLWHFQIEIEISVLENPLEMGAYEMIYVHAASFWMSKWKGAWFEGKTDTEMTKTQKYEMNKCESPQQFCHHNHHWSFITTSQASSCSKSYNSSVLNDHIRSYASYLDWVTKPNQKKTNSSITSNVMASPLWAHSRLKWNMCHSCVTIFIQFGIVVAPFYWNVHRKVLIAIKKGRPNDKKDIQMRFKE